MTRIDRIRRMSAHEITTRAWQAIAAWRERHGLSADAREPDPRRFARMLAPSCAGAGEGTLLEGFRERRTAAFPALDDPAGAAAVLRERWPEAAAALLDEAGRAGAGRFDLLGHRNLSFGNPIDWQLDPLTGRRARLVPSSRLPYLDPAEVGDHKVVWELGRHQHLVTMAQAYALTADDAWAEALLARLTHWIDANPPKRGMHWASSLEVSFRAIAWTWALHLIRRSPALTPERYRRALALLHLHARHLAVHLSTYFSPNTHLTGEALGLVYVGSHFPELAGAPRWTGQGTAVLRAELDRQVRSDGVYFEQSTYYHRYTTDFYLHFALLARQAGQAFDESLRAPLSALLDHIVALMRPDRRWPLVGDDDGGRILILNRRDSNDFRDTVALGGALLERPDYCFAAGAPAPELVWLLGSGGPARFDRIGRAEPAVPTAFPVGGYFVMRDGWEDTANYLLADCGPVGGLNGGHGHADTLAVEVVALGSPIFVDPGTFTYVAGAADRNEFRMSSAHSTVTVAGESSSMPATPFRWSTRAEARVHRWDSDREVDYLDGSHDGYARLDPPATHRREILFLRGRCWVVRDEVRGGAHPFEVRWHAAPGVTATPADARNCRFRAPAGPGLELAVSAGELSLEPARSSPGFGVAQPSTMGVVRVAAGAGSRIVTVLVPVAATERPLIEFAADRVRIASGAWSVDVFTGDESLRLASVADSEKVRVT